VFTSANYTAMANEGYVINSDVYACINEITRAAKGIKWKLYSGRVESRKPVEDSPLLDLIERPNPKMGWGAYFEQYVGYLMIAGNTYVVRNGPTNRPPRELWPLRPDRMRMIKGSLLEPISHFVYTAGGVETPLLPDAQGQTVLHTKLWHPTDDWYGLSPLQAASRNVDQSNEIQKWNVALMQNAARPAGALVADGELSTEQFGRLDGMLREKYSGTMNAGMPMLLEGGLKWEKIALTPAELDWLGGDERTSRKICSAFGVPPELIGIMAKGGLNDSNFVQARKKFYLETILPLMDFIRDDYNYWLAPLFGEDLYLDYDRDDIEAIQEDRDIVYTRNNNAVKSGWMMVNEARVKAGLPEVKGGNVFLIPSVVQMVDENGQVVTAAAPTAKLIDQPARLPAGKQPPALPPAKSDPTARLLERASRGSAEKKVKKKG